MAVMMVYESLEVWLSIYPSSLSYNYKYHTISVWQIIIQNEKHIYIELNEIWIDI